MKMSNQFWHASPHIKSLRHLWFRWIPRNYTPVRSIPASIFLKKNSNIDDLAPTEAIRRTPRRLPHGRRRRRRRRGPYWAWVAGSGGLEGFGGARRPAAGSRNWGGTLHRRQRGTKHGVRTSSRLPLMFQKQHPVSMEASRPSHQHRSPFAASYPSAPYIKVRTTGFGCLWDLSWICSDFCPIFRVIPHRRFQPEAYRLYLELLGRYGVSLSFEKSSDLREKYVSSILFLFYTPIGS